MKPQSRTQAEESLSFFSITNSFKTVKNPILTAGTGLISELLTFYFLIIKELTGLQLVTKYRRFVSLYIYCYANMRSYLRTRHLTQE